jgi:hypothetical protein
MVFEVNLLAIGMGMSCQWWYATKNYRLTESLKPAYVQRVMRGNLIVPAVSAICILVALAGVLWSTALYMALPVVHYLADRYLE